MQRHCNRFKINAVVFIVACRLCMIENAVVNLNHFWFLRHVCVRLSTPFSCPQVLVTIRWTQRSDQAINRTLLLSLA